MKPKWVGLAHLITLMLGDFKSFLALGEKIRVVFEREGVDGRDWEFGKFVH